MYRNNNGAFENAEFPLPGVVYCSGAWGDYDNDADLDLLITGDTVPLPRPATPISGLYRNDNCSDFRIAKSVLPDTGLNYHGLVTYTITLTNTGPVGADRVRVTDTLPSAVEFARWITQSAAIRTSDTIAWAGPIPANDAIIWSWIMTHTGTYDDVVTNTAQYLYERAEQTGADSATSFVKPAPDLAITKTVAPRLGVSLNDIVTYTVMLHNTDPQDAPRVWVTDSMPAAVEFAGWLQKNGAELNDNLITWNGPVSGSTVLSWQWVATVLTQPYGLVSNTASYYFPAAQQSGQSSDWFAAKVYYLPTVSKNATIQRNSANHAHP